MDAAAVVAEIEATVARRRAAGEYPEELLRRLSVEFNPAEEDAPELLAVVGTPRPIASRRRVVGPGVVFAKRALRRLLSWYVQPVATDQTRFNLALLREFRRVEREVDRLRTVWPSDNPIASNGVTSSAAVQSQVAAIASALAEAAAPVLVAGAPTSMMRGIAAALPDRQVIRCADPLDSLETAAPQTIGAIVLAGVLQRMAPGELLAILPAAVAALRPGGVVVIDVPETLPADDALARRAIPLDAVVGLCRAAGLSGMKSPTHDGAGWGLVTGTTPTA